MKRGRLAGSIILGALFILVGYLLIARKEDGGNETTQIETVSRQEKPEQVEKVSKQKKSGMDEEEALTEEEFLEQYLYGEWRFNRRILIRDNSLQEYPDRYMEPNFTDEGVEGMKQLVIHYGKDGVTASGLHQSTFTHPNDVRLFAVYGGGFRNVQAPEYRIHWERKLVNIDLLCEEEEFRINGKDTAVGINYGLEYKEYSNATFWGRNIGDSIYVDPEEADTIYMELAGFWELKRVEEPVADGGEEMWRGIVTEEDWEKQLTQADKEFLEKHVYGNWRMSKRLVSLDESGKQQEDISYNFSSEGVEELIGDMEIGYHESCAGDFFVIEEYSNPRDIYLLYAYGGGCEAKNPVYHVKGETEEIQLRNIYEKERQRVVLPDGKKLVEVTYDLGYDTGKYPAVMMYGVASHLYVDPESTDKLYLDYCGLWELERKERGY